MTGRENGNGTEHISNACHLRIFYQHFFFFLLFYLLSFSNYFFTGFRPTHGRVVCGFHSSQFIGHKGRIAFFSVKVDRLELFGKYLLKKTLHQIKSAITEYSFLSLRQQSHQHLSNGLIQCNFIRNRYNKSELIMLKSDS